MNTVYPYLLALNAAEGVLQIGIARLEQEPVLPLMRASSMVTLSSSVSVAGLEPSSNPATGLLPPCGTWVTLHTSAWYAPSQGAEMLTPALQDACARLRILPRHITHIACVHGPGSFTGLRLVLGTAAGISRSTGAGMASVGYLPLLAMKAVQSVSMCEDFSDHIFWVLTHARRGLVHMQGFTTPGTGQFPPTVLPMSDILVLSLENACARIRESGCKAFLSGSGISRNEAFWQEQLPSLPPSRLMPVSFDQPCMDIFLAVAATLSYEQNDISPLYVRPCDAEENLTGIATSLGLVPQEAQAALQRLTGAIQVFS